MLSSQLLDFVKNNSLLLAREMNLPHRNIHDEFEKICSTEEGYEVLYSVTCCNGGNTCAILCNTEREAAKLQETIDGACISVYALRKRDAAAVTQPQRASRPSLVPSSSVTRREYRVTTRDDFIMRSPSGAEASLKTVKNVVADAVHLNTQLTDSVAVKREDASFAPLIRTDTQVVKENTVVHDAALPEDDGATRKETAEKRQQTLFGDQLSGEKRVSPSGGRPNKVEPKAKKPRVASKKAKKAEDTTSLVKLARASAKNRTTKKGSSDAASSTATAACIGGILDDDGQESCRSSRSSWQGDSGFTGEEEPALDVTIAAPANDDIILCDDTPPMIFCSPEAALDSQKKRGRPQQECDAPAAVVQPRLTSFFQPDVVAFQRSFTRDVTSETVFENDEYICRDKVCYRQKTTGEVISEEEYHRRSAEVMQSSCTDDWKAKLNGCSPPHAIIEAKCTSVETRGGGGRQPKVERQVRSQPKTLMSYFKTSSP